MLCARTIRSRIEKNATGATSSRFGRAAHGLRTSGLAEGQSILVYAPLPEELDVWPLLMVALAAGKTVSLPRFDAEQKNYVACQ